jgi:hypothetical protein
MTVRYEMPDRALELAQKHGLKVMIDTYARNDQPQPRTSESMKNRNKSVRTLSDEYMRDPAAPWAGHSAIGKG